MKSNPQITVLILGVAVGSAFWGFEEDSLVGDVAGLLVEVVSEDAALVRVGEVEDLVVWGPAETVGSSHTGDYTM